MIDPEAFDPSEEQLNASIGPGVSGAGAKASNRRAGTRCSQTLSPANDPDSGEVLSQQALLLAGNNEERPTHQTGRERIYSERKATDTTAPPLSDLWREEVAKRVEGYRNRRSRKRLAGEFSMRFDFEESRPPVLQQDRHTTAAEPAFEQEVPQSSMPDIATDGRDSLPLPQSDVPVDFSETVIPAWSEPTQTGVPESKIIEFPRPLVFPEFVESDPYALAEPVFEKPRILDVPETVGAVPPPLVDIASEQEDPHDDSPPYFELPLRVAPLVLRIGAAVVDIMVVTLACGIFAFILADSIGSFPHSKAVLALALAVPVVFWSVYNYLFLVHAAATPGMTLAHVRLSTFEGRSVPQSLRRWRALLMVLSCASLGFGFLWAVFDQDCLSWHDKLTHTYLTTEL